MPRVPPAPAGGPRQYDAPGYGPQDGADQQYHSTQQYQAAPPYAGPTQYGQYNGPHQQPGQQYGDPQQYGGPQYGGPQHDPQYGGPQYGAHPYPDPQQADPQYANAQYADPRYAGPQARGTSPLSALRSRGPLIPIAAVGAVAVVVIVAVLLATNHNTPSQTASQTTPGSSQGASGSSQDAAQKAAATQLSSMLKQSGAYHADVNAAVGDVESCQRLRTARTAFGASAANRENLLSELRTLPGRATLPAPLLQDLSGAWQASVQVDNDLHDWAQDKVNGGCNPKTVQNNPHYQASLGPDSTATTDKQAFATAWAPIAAKYGLPAYQADQI
jgi:hypothetical protein